MPAFSFPSFLPSTRANLRCVFVLHSLAVWCSWTSEEFHSRLRAKQSSRRQNDGFWAELANLRSSLKSPYGLGCRRGHTYVDLLALVFSGCKIACTYSRIAVTKSRNCFFSPDSGVETCPVSRCVAMNLFACFTQAKVFLTVIEKNAFETREKYPAAFHGAQLCTFPR